MFTDCGKKKLLKFLKLLKILKKKKTLVEIRQQKFQEKKVSRYSLCLEWVIINQHESKLPLGCESHIS